MQLENHDLMASIWEKSHLNSGRSYLITALKFSEKATKFEKISHFFWNYLVTFKAKLEIFWNFCDLLKKIELSYWLTIQKVRFKIRLYDWLAINKFIEEIKICWQNWTLKTKYFTSDRTKAEICLKIKYQNILLWKL